MGTVRREGARTSKDVNRNFSSMGAQLGKISMLAKSAFVGAMVVGAKKAVNEFALLEGAMAKFNVVFGENAEDVEAWVNEFREGVPLARREIIQHAAAMQDLLVPMGIARDQATGMTQEWLELAAALAAFNDVPVDQALEAIRSGIAGQSRPLRQFGIDVRESALQQVAFEEGLMKAGEEMSEQARQQALLRQAYRQSSDAVSGYEDQLGSTLLMEQELQAGFKDTLSILGQQLQPEYNTLIGTLNALQRSFRENSEAITSFASGWFKLATIVPGTLSSWVTGAIKASQETKDLNDQLDKLLSSSFEDFDFTQFGRVMVGLQNQMESIEKLSKEMGVDPITLDSYKEIQGHMAVLQSHFETAIRAQEKFGKSTEESAKAVENVRNTFAEINRMQAEAPEDVIFDPAEEARLRQMKDDFKEFENTFFNILAASDEDFSHRMVPDPEEIQKATEAARFFSTTFADGLQQVLFKTQELSDMLKGIAKQLASRALSTLLMGAFTGGFGGAGFFGAMFGGFRASGGGVSPGKGYVVGEKGPEMFYPQSGGSVAPINASPGNINPHAIAGAFEKALDRKLSKLSPGEIYALSQKGRLSY